MPEGAAAEKGCQSSSLALYRNPIGDEGVKALMAAADHGRLAKLEILWLGDMSMQPQFGEEAVHAIADAIDPPSDPRVGQGRMPLLEELWVSREHTNNPRLIAACNWRRIRLGTLNLG